MPWVQAGRAPALCAVLLALQSLPAAWGKAAVATTAPLEVSVVGSLSLTGPLAAESADAHRGLLLLQEVLLADPRPRLGHAGRSVALHLEVRDDGGDEAVAEGLYQEWAGSNGTALLLGPLAPGAARAAARSAGGQPLLQLVATTETEQAAVFSMGVPAGDCVGAGAFQLLRDAGLRSMAVAWANGSTADAPFYRLACEGAAARARSLGFEVVLEQGVGSLGAPIAADLGGFMQVQAEVFVGCGSLADMVELATAAKALGLAAKAMLLSEATSPAFVDVVGPATANYLMSSVSWNTADGGATPACPVFGSPAAFAQRFRARFGSPPSEHAALAAAAGLALATAAANAADAVAPTGNASAATWQVAVQAALKELSAPSFYGPLSFGAGGGLVGAACVTQQARPLSAAGASPGERYRLSDVVRLGSQAQPVLGRGWEQKEREVYPCPAGTVIDAVHADASQCLPCQPGRHRPPGELTCARCAVGYYSDAEGQSACTPCPDGVDCQAMQEAARCPDECLAPTCQSGEGRPGGRPLVDSVCNGFCAVDPQSAGDHHHLRYYCAIALGEELGTIDCTSCPQAVVWSVRPNTTCAVMSALVASNLDDCKAAAVASARCAVPPTVSMVHGTCLCANETCKLTPSDSSDLYTRMAPLALPRAEPGFYLLPWQPGEPMLLEACSPPSLCLGGNQCLDDNVGVLCAQCKIGYMRRLQGRRCEQCESGFSRVLVSALLALLYGAYVAAIARSTREAPHSGGMSHGALVKIFVTHLQQSVLGFEVAQFQVDDKPVLVFLTDFALQPLSSLISLECLHVEGVSPLKAWAVAGLLIPFLSLAVVALGTAARMVVVLQTLDWKLSRQGYAARQELEAQSTRSPNSSGSRHTHRTRGSSSSLADLFHRSGSFTDAIAAPCASSASPLRQAKCAAAEVVLRDGTHWATVVVFVIYPITLKTLVEGIACRQLDVLRLARYLDVQCTVGDYWERVVIVGLVLYGLGMPLVVLWLLRRMRTRLLQDDTRLAYGFLYSGYSHGWYWFEVVHMLRMFAIILCLAIPVMQVRVVTALCLSLCFLAVHLSCKPFDNRDFRVLGYLENGSILAFIATLGLKLYFIVRDQVASSGVASAYDIPFADIVDVVLTVMCALWQALVCALAVWYFLWNTVLEGWHFKAEWDPDRLTYLQRRIVDVAPVHHVCFDPGAHKFGIADLSTRELGCLRAALSDITHFYMSSGRPFHAGRLATALRMGVAKCAEHRRDRVKKLYAKLQRGEDTWSAWLSRAVAHLQAAACCSSADPGSPISSPPGSPLPRSARGGGTRRRTSTSSSPQRNLDSEDSGGSSRRHQWTSQGETRRAVHEALQRVSENSAPVNELQMYFLAVGQDVLSGDVEGLLRIDDPPWAAPAAPEGEPSEGDRETAVSALTARTGVGQLSFCTAHYGSEDERRSQTSEGAAAAEKAPEVRSALERSVAALAQEEMKLMAEAYELRCRLAELEVSGRSMGWRSEDTEGTELSSRLHVGLNPSDSPRSLRTDASLP